MKYNILCFLFIIVSCKTVQINQSPQRVTKNPIEIGAVGVVKKGILTTDFKMQSLPTYKNKIRVLANVISFTKKNI